MPGQCSGGVIAGRGCGIMRPMPADPPCPCGLPARLSACCGRWLAGPLRLQAPDAAALMRSRYSAYVLRLADHLLATWHPSTRPATVTFEAGQRWLGLQVLAHRPLDADHATVAFVARYKLAGRARRLAETSRFLRQEGRWFYVDGAEDGNVDGDVDAA
jgi:SEC-C motif-containing protein